MNRHLKLNERLNNWGSLFCLCTIFLKIFKPYFPTIRKTFRLFPDKIGIEYTQKYRI